MGTRRDCAAELPGKMRTTQRGRLGPAVFALTVLALAGELASWAGNPGVPRSGTRSSAVQDSPNIPAGTILPVRVENSISLKDAHKGDDIEGRIMQDVPLLDKEKINARSRVKGSVVSVEQDSSGTGENITLKFNQIEDRKELFMVTTSLRAFAADGTVRNAQMPFSGVDAGTPPGWANTVQIGGDIRYGDGGKVRNVAKQVVGKGVAGGVLVHIRANPALGCEGPVNGDDHLQALWVFSADACGYYGMKDFKIVHTGRSAPIGEITLHFGKEDAKIDAGVGMLLRTVAQP
jgi:hypothetical protein